MKQLKSLRQRLVGAFIITTFSISTMYGILVFNAMKYTEDDILNQRVKLEAQHFIKQYIQNKSTATLPSSIGLSSYLSTSPDLPDWLKEQPLGSRELHDKELHIHVSTLPNNEGQLYIILSELESSHLEQEQSSLIFILITIGGIMVLAGLIMGSYMSTYIAMPLSQLASEIEKNDDHSPLPFYGFERKDEVGELSRAFSKLIQRLRDLLNREKQFTRFASHELRTPITLIRNALAILKLPNQTSPQNTKNLDRIEHAAIDMDNLINTLLILGREKNHPQNEPIHLAELISSSINKNAYLNHNNKIKLETSLDNTLIIENHTQLVSILIDNAIRNMFIHSHTQASLTLTTAHIQFENDIETKEYNEDIRHGSYGLELIEKISQRCGLNIDVQKNNARYRFTIYLDQA